MSAEKYTGIANDITGEQASPSPIAGNQPLPASKTANISSVNDKKTDSNTHKSKLELLEKRSEENKKHRRDVINKFIEQQNYELELDKALSDCKINVRETYLMLKKRMSKTEFAKEIIAFLGLNNADLLDKERIECIENTDEKYKKFVYYQGKGRSKKKIDTDKLKKLTEAGLSNRQIANVLNVSESLVRNRCKELNIATDRRKKQE